MSLGTVITVGSSRGVGRINLARIFGDSSSGDAVLKRALSKVKPDEGGEAHFRFGKASRFTLTDPNQRTNPSVTYNFPPDDSQDDQQKEIHIIEYDEVWRSSETNRVENPDDSEQYVMDKNVLRVILLSRDDGRYIGLNFKAAKDLK